MDELQHLVDEYRTRASSSVPSKLDVLLDLERIRDPRVVPFLLTVLGDRHEAEKVRIHVLKQLRNGDGLVARVDRPPVAQAIGDVLADNSTPELRLEAALALGVFTEIDGVLTALSSLAVAHEESIDLRYAAFTSLERAGPRPESIALMRKISDDEMLGNSARGVLSAWHVG
jgi:hypothetical protein